MKHLRNRSDGPAGGSAAGTTWAAPAFLLAVGILYLIGATIGGDFRLGLAMFGGMIAAVFGASFIVALVWLKYRG